LRVGAIALLEPNKEPRMSKGRFTLAESLRDMFCQTMQTLLVDGVIEIRSGVMPPTPDSTPLDGEILARASVVWDADRKNAKTVSVPVICSGTAAWARAFDASGYPLWDADCGEAWECSIHLDKADLRIGQMFMLGQIEFFGL
jgi:hypothetical protein